MPDRRMEGGYLENPGRDQTETAAVQNERRDCGTHIIRMLGVLLTALGLCAAYKEVRDHSWFQYFVCRDENFVNGVG